MSRVLRTLALAALALWPALSSAHEMSMAEMELRETSRGEFMWQWSATNDKRAGMDDLTPQWAGWLRFRAECASLQRWTEGHILHRRCRQDLLGCAREGALVRRHIKRIHAVCRSAERAALWLGRRSPRQGRDRVGVHRARDRAHPQRLRSFAVRVRAAVSGGLPAQTVVDDHGFYRRAQSHARERGDGMAHTAIASRRGNHCALHSARCRGGFEPAHDARAPLARAAGVPVRAGAWAGFRRCVERDRLAAETIYRPRCSRSTSESRSVSS